MTANLTHEENCAQTSTLAIRYLRGLFAQSDYGEMPNAAADAIVEGARLQSVYELAGMSRLEDPRALSRAVKKVSEDLGLGNLSDRESRSILIETILKQAVASMIEPHVAGQMIYLLRTEFGQTDDYRKYWALIAYAVTWDEDVNLQSEVDDLIVREARALL